MNNNASIFDIAGSIEAIKTVDRYLVYLIHNVTSKTIVGTMLEGGEFAILEQLQLHNLNKYNRLNIVLYLVFQ